MEQTEQQFTAKWITDSREMAYGGLQQEIARRRRDVYFAAKRLVDVIIAGIALVALLPLLLIVAILVCLDSQGPAIFKQERVTAKRRGNSRGETWEVGMFTCYKFRSMYNGTKSDLHEAFIEAFIKNDTDGMVEVQGQKSHMCKLVNDPRISRIGHFIRKTSIDELPQLWNVLKGDMSIVGPRPAIPYEVEQYEPWHRARLQAKPGLTGWWQIKGRGSVEFDDGIRQDIWYVEHQSPVLDTLIVLKTPAAVLTRKGAL